jgi:hypothetical protein
MIRDFGEKIRFLVRKKDDPELGKMDGVKLPSEFPLFRNQELFVKRLKLGSASSMNQWCDDNRNIGRLAPDLSQAITAAELFGIWPKGNLDVDITAWWSQHWPSWFSSPATDQYKGSYKRPKDGDNKPDSFDKFKEAYQRALRLHSSGSGESLLHFSFATEKELLRQKASDDLFELFKAAPSVLAYLKRQNLTGLPLRKSAVGKSFDDTVIRRCADWFLDQGPGVDAVIKACLAALTEIEQAAHEPDLDLVRNKLIEFARRVVPALCVEDAVATISPALRKEIVGLVKVPAYRRAAAEILVAAVESRPASFLPRKTRSEWPVGTRSFLDHTPDNGINASDEHAQHIRTLLTQTFSSASQDELGKAFEKFIAGGPFCPEPEIGTEFPASLRYKLAAQNIADRIEFDKQCFYMMFHPRDNQTAEALENLAFEISKDIPGMLFMRLSLEPEIMEQDNRRFNSLILMLPTNANEGAA